MRKMENISKSMACLFLVAGSEDSRGEGEMFLEGPGVNGGLLQHQPLLQPRHLSIQTVPVPGTGF